MLFIIIRLMIHISRLYNTQLKWRVSYLFEFSWYYGTINEYSRSIDDENSRESWLLFTLIRKSDRETRQIRLFSGTWYAFGLSDTTDSTVLRHVDPNHPLKSFTSTEGVEDHARCSVRFKSISSTIFRFARFV